MGSPGETKVSSTQLLPILERGRLEKLLQVFLLQVRASPQPLGTQTVVSDRLIMFSTEDPEDVQRSVESPAGRRCRRQVVGGEANTSLDDASRDQLSQSVREERIL